MSPARFSTFSYIYTSTQETTHRHREGKLLTKVTQHGSTSRRAKEGTHYPQSCASHHTTQQ